MAQAIPNNLSMGNSARPAGGGLLRILSNDDLDAAAAAEQKAAEAARRPAVDNLAAHVQQRFQSFQRERDSSITGQLLASLRAYRGEYDPAQLQDIAKFGGSKVYARLTALKCRGATAMLRDVYLGGDRPWFILPTPSPTLPEPINASVDQLIQSEMMALQMMGQAPDMGMVERRRAQLLDAAYVASRKQAAKEARKAEAALDDLLVEGQFYTALVEFLHDITVFPYAVIKGPVVQMDTKVSWQNGKAVEIKAPRMFWYRVNPFDFWWSPSATRIDQAEVIQKLNLTRRQLNALIGVPGYDTEALRAVLIEYETGYQIGLDTYGQQEADLERREGPSGSEDITTLEYQGWVKGQWLLDWGFTPEEVPDGVLDYFVTCWVIGSHVIKAQLNPDPNKRHNFYVSSFEKVPGAVAGHSLPEILADIQAVINATLRSLVNNMSIASGPQTVVNDDRMAIGQDSDSLYPWKRWHVTTDPMGSTEKPVDFFQPDSRATELMAVYEKMSVIADEVSAIPRYMTGSERLGGAGRTASGLSMLMGNASKVLQSVAANIDHDVLSPLLRSLYDYVMLTDPTGILRGDETVQVRGVVFAMQKETERQRLLEALQLTGNPVDMSIIGQTGRAELLREVFGHIGLNHEAIVPTAEALQQQLAQQQQLAMQQAAAQTQGDPTSGTGETLANTPGSGGIDDKMRQQSNTASGPVPGGP